MCNLYSMTRSGDAMRNLFSKFAAPETNLRPLPGIITDVPAPIIRDQGNGVAALTMTRWGMPSSKKALLNAATKRADMLRAKNDPWLQHAQGTLFVKDGHSLDQCSKLLL